MIINGKTLDGNFDLLHPLSFPIKGNSAVYWSPSYVRAQINSTITAASAAFTSNTIYLFPFIVPKKMIIASAVFRQTGGSSAGRTMRFGIYTDDGNCYPKNLVGGTDNGDISNVTNNVKTITYTSNVVLQPGLYWYALLFNSSSITIRRILADCCINVLGYKNDGTLKNSGWQVSFTYAVLPFTFPSGATVQQLDFPIFCFQLLK